jgi:hypothetical protein
VCGKTLTKIAIVTIGKIGIAVNLAKLPEQCAQAQPSW